MPREIIRPPFGELCLLQLACPPEGTQREGQYGVDYEYILNNDQAITWLPKDARDAIVQSGAQEGDEISLQKIKRGRQTIWTVERIADETTKHETKPKPPAKPDPLKQQAALAQHIAQQTKPAPTPAAKPEPHRPGAQLLAGALCAAIDAATYAAEYARSKGLALSWDAGDIRALAATLYIDSRKEGK